MSEVVIDKKKYVLLSEKEHKGLQLKAALKTKPAKLLSFAPAGVLQKGVRRCCVLCVGKVGSQETNSKNYRKPNHRLSRNPKN